MGNVKSKGSKAISTHDKAILDLKIQRDRLLKYQKKIESVIERETCFAKQLLLEGRKDKALLMMKKKKYQEGLLEQTDSQLLNLEQMVNSIEYSLVEKDVLDGLKRGNQVLATIHQETSLDDVEKLMKDTADAIAYQNEIERMIGGALPGIDEQELLEDLESIVLKQAADLSSNLPSTTGLPEVPMERISRKEVKKAPVALYE